MIVVDCGIFVFNSIFYIYLYSVVFFRMDIVVGVKCCVIGYVFFLIDR